MTVTKIKKIQIRGHRNNLPQSQIKEINLAESQITEIKMVEITITGSQITGLKNVKITIREIIWARLGITEKV